MILDHGELDKSIAKRLRQRPPQPEVAIQTSGAIAATWAVRRRRDHLATLYRARCGRESRICRWNFDAICYSSGDIIISGFGGHTAMIAISGALYSPFNTLRIPDTCCGYTVLAVAELDY